MKKHGVDEADVERVAKEHDVGPEDVGKDDVEDV